MMCFATFYAVIAFLLEQSSMQMPLRPSIDADLVGSRAYSYIEAPLCCHLRSSVVLAPHLVSLLSAILNFLR